MIWSTWASSDLAKFFFQMFFRTVLYKMSVSCNIGGLHFGAIIKFWDKFYTPALEWDLPFRKLNLELFYSYLSERNIIAAVIWERRARVDEEREERDWKKRLTNDKIDCTACCIRHFDKKDWYWQNKLSSFVPRQLTAAETVVGQEWWSMDSALTHLGCVYKLTELIFIFFTALLFVNIIILYIFVYSCSF